MVHCKNEMQDRVLMNSSNLILMNIIHVQPAGNGRNVSRHKSVACRIFSCV